jgi:acetyl-CoA carboxylase biotin carboxylase subunit
MPRAGGIKTVAVHSARSGHRALHVRFADEAVCIGPATRGASYLHVPAIIAAAEITGADAIHPGYGFLSENAEFADDLRRSAAHVDRPDPRRRCAQWGDKVTARATGARFGLPLLPGTGVLADAEHAVARRAHRASPSCSRRRAAAAAAG